jgi:hypothetical protein
MTLAPSEPLEPPTAGGGNEDSGTSVGGTLRFLLTVLKLHLEHVHLRLKLFYSTRKVRRLSVRRDELLRQLGVPIGQKGDVRSLRRSGGEVLNPSPELADRDLTKDAHD